MLRPQSQLKKNKIKWNFQSRTLLTDDLKVPKKRRRYLGSRGACDCQKASRPWRGVPGCGPLLCPPSRSALIFSARRLAAGEGRRRFVTPLPSTGFEGGGGGGGVWRGLAVGGGRHPALLSIELPASSHPLTRAQPRTRRELRPPVVALATLRQIQTFVLKAEPKPTSADVCLPNPPGVAFRSC